MTQEELNKLYENNIKEVNKLNIGSRQKIKALLQGINNHGEAYIKLSGAIEGGNKINYTHIEGEKNLVTTIANFVGLKINDTTLETHYS
ncbi:MAG: hypothetical protein HRT37_11805 [Alteromonadaceae bacterium]|nr:hypothetical protein [Alteromonadaceae bacterium]